MLKSVSGYFVRLAERWMPDPLVIAIALTMVCFSAVIIFTPFDAMQTVMPGEKVIGACCVSRPK